MFLDFQSVLTLEYRISVQREQTSTFSAIRKSDVTQVWIVQFSLLNYDNEKLLQSILLSTGEQKRYYVSLSVTISPMLNIVLFLPKR